MQSVQNYYEMHSSSQRATTQVTRTQPHIIRMFYFRSDKVFYWNLHFLLLLSIQTSFNLSMKNVCDIFFSCDIYQLVDDRTMKVR